MNYVSEKPVSQPKHEIELIKDVEVVVRDGSKIIVDVYRPDGPGKYPVLLAASPYQKDLDELIPKSMPPFFAHEMPEARFFVPRGYVIVRADLRGIGKSPGYFEMFSRQEAEDMYDVIEWAAVQEWSNGNVSTGGGVGYYSFLAWNIAALQPPSLKTILSWDGGADVYRDFFYHGGIYNSFSPTWYATISARQLQEASQSHNPEAFKYNAVWDQLRHPLDGLFWRERAPNLTKIDIPVFMTDSWELNNVHCRGNIEAYYQLQERGNRNIKLRIHANHDEKAYPDCIVKHTCAFFSEEGQLDQLRWYDYWLKGIETGIMDEPSVKLRIRDGEIGAYWRFEEAWPIPCTQWKKYYLDPKNAKALKASENDGTLSEAPPEKMGETVYDVSPGSFMKSVLAGKPVITFVTEPIKEPMEVTGPIKLVLWVSASTSEMDIYATLQDMGPKGMVDHITQGWLKVSHRKLDLERTTPWRPFHSHDEIQKLDPGEVVKVEVEVLPTSHVFKKGHRVRLDISPYGPNHYPGSFDKLGQNIIYTGGDRSSYLQLPLIPGK